MIPDKPLANIRSCASRIAREEDKRQHVGCSMALMLYFYLFFQSALPAMAASLILGWIKELFDARFGSGFCWYDIAANTVGVAFAWLLLALYILVQQGA